MRNITEWIMAKSFHYAKLYFDIIDDVKVGLLNDALKWRFVSCIALAGLEEQEARLAGREQEPGFLPAHSVAAYRLRIHQQQYTEEMTILSQRGLAELRPHPDGDERYFLTNFAKRQAPATGTERSRNSRRLIGRPVDNSSENAVSGWFGWLVGLEEKNKDLTNQLKDGNDIATIRCIVDAFEEYGIKCNTRTQAIALSPHVTADHVHDVVEETRGNIKLAIWRLENLQPAKTAPHCPLCGGRHPAESCAYNGLIQR